MVSITVDITEDDFRQLQWIVENLCQDLPDVNNPRHLVLMMVKDFAESARRGRGK